jgi:hypothetical protein
MFSAKNNTKKEILKYKIFKAFPPSYNSHLNKQNTFEHCLFFIGSLHCDNSITIKGYKNVILGCKDKHANAPIFLLVFLYYFKYLFTVIKFKIIVHTKRIKKFLKK